MHRVATSAERIDVWSGFLQSDYLCLLKRIAVKTSPWLRFESAAVINGKTVRCVLRFLDRSADKAVILTWTTRRIACPWTRSCYLSYSVFRLADIYFGLCKMRGRMIVVVTKELSASLDLSCLLDIRTTRIFKMANSWFFATTCF